MRERERETGPGEIVVMDVCPSCRGIWLDSGELEKLTASEARYYEAPPPPREPREYREYRRKDDDDDDDDDRRRYPSGGGYSQQKRKGFLSNLFGNLGGDDD